MKTWNHVSKSGPAAAVAVAGVLVLATGCVHRVTHVHPVQPVRVEAPAPLPPPAPVVVTPPPAPVVFAPPPQVVLPPPAPAPRPLPPPPAPVVYVRMAAELDRMLAPIALYPDPLLAQILHAATLPGEVVLVDRYLREGGHLSRVDAQPWDNSLKALARYPATLRMMADNLAWTTDLGQAFLNQPADVMGSVQRLRAQARALGNLQTTPQQVIVVNGGVIEILPPAPQIIYVPVYQPEVVYVRPPPAPGRFHISFGTGLLVGAWLNHDCDWHHHRVIVWHHERPRPTDWWHRPPHRRETPAVASNVTVVNNTTIVNQNFTVWRPAAPAPRATVVRATEPARNQPAAPAAREEVPRPAVTAQRPDAAREVRPAPVVKTEVTAPVPVPKEVRPPAAAVAPRKPVVAREAHAVPVAAPTVNAARPAVPARDTRPAGRSQTPIRPPAVANNVRAAALPVAVPAPAAANATVQRPAGNQVAKETPRAQRELNTQRGQGRAEPMQPARTNNLTEGKRPAGRKVQ